MRVNSLILYSVLVLWDGGVFKRVLNDYLRVTLCWYGRGEKCGCRRFWACLGVFVRGRRD